MHEIDLPVIARSRIISSLPFGPSQRNYANAAMIVESEMSPPELLDHLKALEARFGRRKRGERWRSRILDLDIILWSSGFWASPRLSIPHMEFRGRRFVIDPSCQISPDWRDPLTGLSLRHLKARLDRKRPHP